MAAGALHTAPQMRGLHAGGAEDGAAAGEDATHRVQVELAVVAFQQALPAVVEPDHLVAVVDHGAVHDGPDDGVESGAVAAAGQHTNTHCSRYSRNSTGRPDPFVRVGRAPCYRDGLRGLHGDRSADA